MHSAPCFTLSDVCGFDAYFCIKDDVKMDLILTKSISRFARNTLDTIQYTRMLRAMGIGIYFEKENINTLDMDSEMLITMLGAFAQAESESISRNVAWGKRKAIRDGKVSVNFNLLYGYYLREDGSPAFHSDKAEVVQYIYISNFYMAIACG